MCKDNNINNNKDNNNNNRDTGFSFKEYMDAKSKTDFLLNVETEDKKKLISLLNWSNRALELSVLERIEKRFIKAKKGEVWSVDLGDNVGTEINNVRPCIIVKDSMENFPLVTLCPVTNNSHIFLPSQIAVNDLGLEGILTGTTKTEQIRTVSKGRLGKKICDLSENAIIDLDMILLRNFDYDERIVKIMEILMKNPDKLDSITHSLKSLV